MKRLLAITMSMAGAGALFAVSPDFSGTYPAGGQRGTEVDVEFRGNRLDDTKEILFYEPGIEVLKLNSTANKVVKARLKIAPTAELGEHPVRIRTTSGVSDLETFYVSPFPNVDEDEKAGNNSKDKPQKISANVTINGTINQEDEDWFALDVKKGQRIGIEAEGIRLGRDLVDPVVTIFNPDGSQLKLADDSAMFVQDPAATVLAPKDGTYFIRIQDAPNDRGRTSMYRLHVGNFPRPLAVYPAGGKAGEKLTVKFLGDAAGEFTQEVTLPKTPMEKFPIVAVNQGLSAPSPNWLRVSEYGNVLEKEPNNDLKSASGSASITLPIAFNGVIEKNGDEDWFHFTAKKGEQYDINVEAQSIRSPLDSVLNVYDKNGRSLAGNDDSGGADSYLRFKVPADGDYYLRITDHLGRGGEYFAYRIEAGPVVQSLEYSIPEVARNDSQSRQAMVIPRGNRFMTLMNIKRQNFGGEVVFDAQGLPPGVKVDVDNIPGNLTTIPVVFEAAPDAAIGSKLVDLRGKLVEKSKDGKETQRPLEGTLNQKLDLVLERPNQTVYYSTYVDKLVVAVTEEAPYKIDIVEPKVPLVREGSMDLEIKVTRKPGFEDPITVYLPFRPPGVSARSSVQVPKGATSVKYPINANSRAETKVWRIAALAQANVKGAPLFISSAMTKLEVADPFVTLKFNLALAEQGKDSQVVCKLDQKIPFEGKAKMKLMGLPPKVTTQEIEITKDMKEAVFPLKVDPKSPLGMHRNIYCELVIEKNNEPITHNFGARGSLRISAPEKKAAEAKPAAPAKTAKK